MGCMERLSDTAVCPRCGWRDVTAPESPLYLPPRTTLQEQYLVGRVLGHGGFGITYLGWDLNLESKLAVKEYLPSGVATRTTGTVTVSPFSGQARQDFDWGLEKFLEEGRVLARFKSHPGIASVFNFFRANGTAYLVMEYLEGCTLAQYLDQHDGQIPFGMAVRVLAPVMQALREVHGAGILHRDISPDNIYITRSGPVKLLDFGAARYALGQHSRNLSVILKEGYAPEEQYRTKGVQGPWTDVYATAATLYGAITGKIPPPALDRLDTDELIPPSSLGVDINPPFERSLLKALAVRAADRYQSIEDFEAAITTGGTAGFGPGSSTLSSSRARTFRAQPLLEPTPPATAPPVAPAPSATVAPDASAPAPGTQPIAAPVAPPRKGFPIWVAVAAVLGLAGMAYLATLARRKPAETAQPPVIQSFQAAPASISKGRAATLSWSVQNAAEVSIDHGVGRQSVAGSASVSPEESTTYTLTAKGPSGATAMRTAPVSVGPATIPSGDVTQSVPEGDQVARPRPRKKEDALGVITKPPPGPSGDTLTKPQPEAQIDSFGFSPDTVSAGQSTTLSWSVRGASQVFIQPQIGSVPAQGRLQIQPTATLTYTLMAVAPAGTAQSSAVVNVTGGAAVAPALVITSFEVQPPSIQQGQSAALRWSVAGAVQAYVEPDIGNLTSSSGERAVSPAQTTNYTLVARAANGATARKVAVLVVQPGVGSPIGGPGQQGRPSFSVAVSHDHGGAVSRIPGRRPNAPDFCLGQLSVTGDRIRFQASNQSHSFDLPLRNILEVAVNRLGINGSRAFHIRFQGGDNFNFVPRGDVSQVVRAIEDAQRRAG